MLRRPRSANDACYQKLRIRFGGSMSTSGRKLQVGLLVFAVFVVMTVIFVYAARDNLIRYTLNPSESFESAPRPAPPNYAASGAWSFRDASASKRADVFFIYPTVFFSGEFWNAPTSNSAVSERLTRIIKPLYAGPFEQSANLQMPLYRQAVPYSFMSGSENGRAARLLAYSDVKRAFDEYLLKSKPDRPFIIAGYGQGAMYGLKLLAEMKPATRARLVAAYLLEAAIPIESLTGMVKGVPLCDSPDQTGCAVIWHSTTQNARGDLPRENALVWRPSGGFDATRGRELACVNPLTWTISGRAGSPDMNLGAARLTDFGPRDVSVTPASTSADCWNGLLFTDVTPEPIFLWSGPRYRELFPSSINPFYADIKDNVRRRIESHVAQKSMGPVTETGEPQPVIDSDASVNADAGGPLNPAPEVLEDESQPAASESPPSDSIPATEPQ